MEDFRRFGASKDDSSLRAIVQGLAEDQKHALAFKQGDMACFGVAVAEILEVDGDQVYARIGPNTGWYDKDEINNLGLTWKSADEFNKREVTDHTVVIDAAPKKAQMQSEEGAFIVRRKTSPHSAVGLYMAWPVEGGFRYHANTGRPARRVSYLPADEFWREFEKFDRRSQVERVADVSPFLFRSRYLKQDAPPPVPKTDVENKMESEEAGEACQCPACGGQANYMGKLGNVEWCRCESCGMDVSRGGRTGNMKRSAESAEDIIRQLEAGELARPAAIRKLSGLAISEPEAVRAAFTKIRLTPEEVARLQEEAHAFESPSAEEEGGGLAVAPTPRSAPPASPESAEAIPEEGKAEAIPETFMDKFDVQKHIDHLLDMYNAGEITLEKLRYRMKDLVIRKGCRHAVRLALMNRFAPRSNILDEGVWEKAKAAADKSYNKSDDFYWAAVTDIYKNMGGRMKGKKKGQKDLDSPLMTPESTLYYALKTIKLMTDERNIHEIIDLAVSKWDDAEKTIKESSDLPPAELISRPDIERGDGEDQLRPVD